MPGCIVFIVALVLCYLPACAQENITITTYYPSPYGSYNDLNVHRDLLLKERNNPAAGPVANITNNNGNFTFYSAQPFYQIVFADTGKPFSYLTPFGTSGLTYCDDGYIAVNYLDTDSVVNYTISGSLVNTPTQGYVVCVRGWE